MFFVPFIMPCKVLILPSSDSLIIQEGNKKQHKNKGNYYLEGLEM